MMLRLAILLALGLATAHAQPYQVQTRTGLAYGPAAEEAGDAYLPTDAPGPWPAVVMIHGGGWITGARATLAPLATVLAQACGVAVFNIDYRLAVRDRPDTHWPAQLSDAQLAVRYLRAHATDLGIDPARIGAIGDSVGGQLAVFLGTRRDIAPGDRSALFPTQRPDVMVVVDQFGPMDVLGMGPGSSDNVQALFGTKTPPARAARSASPIASLTDVAAPTYIIHGQSDSVVPVAQSRALDNALSLHRVPHQLTIFPGGHEYEGVDAAGLQLGGIAWLVKWLAPASVPRPGC